MIETTTMYAAVNGFKPAADDEEPYVSQPDRTPTVEPDIKLKLIKRPIERLFYKICLKTFLILAGLHILLILYLRKFYHRRVPDKKRNSASSTSVLDEVNIVNEYGQGKYIQLPVTKLFYVENGHTSKPLLLLIHGFPDYWISWRHQINRYAQNYHVVAIDLPGCGNSEKFDDKSYYKLDVIMKDLKHLIFKLGKEKATIIAHDIGAIILYQFLLQYPKLVEKYITISAVPPYAFNANLKQILTSWYVCLFQLPNVPERYLSANKLSVFNNFNRCPNQKIKEIYKFAFEKPNAYVGPVNYFRANTITALLYIIFGVENVEKKNFPPGLVIYGLDDDVILPETYKNVKTVPRLQIKQIAGGGHYVHQQLPELVNEVIDNFLYEEISVYR